MGKANHAIALDCASLKYEYVPLHMEGYKLVIANTNKKRGLADSKYNERRSECEQAVASISSRHPITFLCELTPTEFGQYCTSISDPIVYRRAKHAVHEHARVKQAIDALKAGKLTTFGQLMNASHRSLKDDYEVTGIELDTLAEEGQQLEGVLGSRMTGAGFGGCTVTLIQEKQALIEMIKWAIRQESGVAGRGPYRQKKIATKITSSNGSAALLPADS